MKRYAARFGFCRWPMLDEALYNARHAYLMAREFGDFEQRLVAEIIIVRRLHVVRRKLRRRGYRGAELTQRIALEFRYIDADR